MFYLYLLRSSFSYVITSLKHPLLKITAVIPYLFIAFLLLTIFHGYFTQIV
jgi:hypothetical protein